MAETPENCAETQVSPLSKVWDTRMVGQSEAFDFYRESICAAFMPLRPEVDARGRTRFQAKVTSRHIDDGILNFVSAHAHRVQRSRREIAASDSECYYLNTQFEGDCHIKQRGTSITLRAGDVGIFDGAEPFDLRHDNCPSLKVASLMVPKQVLHDAFGAPLETGPEVLSRHPILGPLLSEAGRSLATAASQKRGDGLSGLYRVFLSVAAMTAKPRTANDHPATRNLVQVQSIRQIIRRNFADLEFGVSDCAALMGLSVGHVQHLLAQNHTRFGRLLLQERLAMAAQWLSDPMRSHQSVATIAFSCGFKDTSHFGRAFRERYDLSPGEWRRQNHW